MFKSKQVAGAAAFLLVGSSFLLTYGATSFASTLPVSLEAPVLATPVIIAANSVEPSAVADASADQPTTTAADGSDNAVMTHAAASLDELVQNWQDDTPLDADANCLATAVFFEARSESLSGQLAVANVILAREHSGHFPDSLCSVVLQPHQFGFVRGGKLPKVPTGRPAWATAKAIAQIALAGAWRDPVDGALYFHATYSSPGWGREQVAQIGQHIFYR